MEKHFQINMSVDDSDGYTTITQPETGVVVSGYEILTLLEEFKQTLYDSWKEFRDTPPISITGKQRLASEFFDSVNIDPIAMGDEDVEPSVIGDVDAYDESEYDDFEED